MEERKLWEYESEKPELSDDLLMHYGVKGMKWGVRHDKPRLGTRKKGLILKKKKKKTQTPMTKERALETKNLKYMNEHKSEFTTQEINNVLNRVNAEANLSRMAYQTSTKAKVKKILTSKPAKIVGGMAIGAFAVVGSDIYMRYQSNGKAPKASDIRNILKNTGQNYVGNKMETFVRDFTQEPKYKKQQREAAEKAAKAAKKAAEEASKKKKYRMGF